MLELICPPVLLHILPTYVMFSANSSLGNTLIMQKILFCVNQTMLSLGIFIDLTKEMGTNDEPLQQASGNKTT